MRVCPVCRAELNDFDSICEYCGTELPVNIEFESCLTKAETIFNLFERISKDSYKLTKADLTSYKEYLTYIENAKELYGESQKLQEIIKKIEKINPSLQEKIKKYKKFQCKKTVITTILLSFLSIFGILTLLTLISIFSPEDVKTWTVGIPALICAFIGAGLSSDSGYLWGGFFGGMIVGGFIGYLIFLLIATPIGQLIFLIVGTVGIIVGTVCRIRGAKKKWQ